MKIYNLFLDESGQFFESAEGTGRVAIVAGYIVENLNGDLESWAKNILEETKNSNSIFNRINIESFHALEDKSPAMSEFVTCLMKRVVAQNGRLVSFKNIHGMYIVDPDKTYLNVFSEGILKLIRHLLAETDDIIQLHITYAHRIYVEKKDVSSAPIPPKEYTERIRERIALRLGRLPQEELKRLIFNMDSREDFAGNEGKYYEPLKIADAVCAALRGKRDVLTPEQIRRIDSVKCLEFSVLENETWNLIQDFIIESRLADAIYTWCIHSDEKPLLQHKNRFYDLLIQKIESMNSVGVNSQFQVLSKLIGSFVDRREIAVANKVMEPLLKDVFPRLENAKTDIARHYFDIWFYRLTTATHVGDTAMEDNAIAQCEMLKKQIVWAYEDLNYILLYKLRKVEHLKNIFAFRKAETELKNMAATLEQAKACLDLIDEYQKAEYKDIKSVVLGKIQGSLVGTKSYIIQATDLFTKEIRSYSDQAILNLTAEDDQLRQYQIRAQAEYSMGNYEEALRWLKKSAKLPENASIAALISSLASSFNSLNIFGLMHYAKIMEAACMEGNEQGQILYNQWNHHNVTTAFLDQLRSNYPAYAMYGSLAVTRVLLNINGSAVTNAFSKAIEKSEASKNNFTCYAAGLSYEAKKLALFVHEPEERKAARIALRNHVNEFLNMRGMPESIKQVFAGWQALFSDQAMDVDAEGYKEQIMEKALLVPIL